MISRHWRGLARANRAQDYVHHLCTDTFAKLGGLPGFRGASILRRALPEGVEFLVVTLWDSLRAIEAFAGSDPEAAVVPDVVREMMLEFDAQARHYEVVEG